MPARWSSCRTIAILSTSWLRVFLKLATDEWRSLWAITRTIYGENSKAQKQPQQLLLRPSQTRYRWEFLSQQLQATATGAPQKIKVRAPSRSALTLSSVSKWRSAANNWRKRLHA